MYFANTLNNDALEKLDQLEQEYAKNKKAFNQGNAILEKRKLDAYQSSTIITSNSAALGSHATANTQTRLPHSFTKDNEQLIADVTTDNQRMSDSRAALSRFKRELVEVIAKEQVAQYESLAGYIAETHAIIAAIEKDAGSFNAGLWNKIRIPAGTNISRLRERADKPLGASMLHYDGKAQKLTQKYQMELTKFLRID